MHRHCSWAACLVLLGTVALLGGCREAGPTSPAEPMTSVTTVQPLGAMHRHQHLVAALRHRAQGYLEARDKATTYRLADPPAGEPLPIPGGVAPGFHVWVPGPPELAPFFMGIDVEPNTITNFNGFVAMAYLLGSATGSDGKTYDQFHDMRIMRGVYVDSEGRRQSGTFAFI